MFVRDFVHVDRPFEELAPRFLRDDQWLQPILVGAVNQVLATADQPTGERVAGGAVTCEWGPARRQSDSVVVPVRSVLHEVVPTLDGDLRISPFSTMRSHISLSAVWGTDGVDPLEVQPVLDTVTRTFLHRLAWVIDQRNRST